MNNSEINDLYYKMLRIRLVEEKIAKLYTEQEMRCPVHLSIGQEAIAVGILSNAIKGDSVFSSHRCHGHYIAHGGDLRSLFDHRTRSYCSWSLCSSTKK